MPLFLIESTDGRIGQVVRAACRACARRVAAENAREEGTALWRNPQQSTVKDLLIEGKNGVVLRREG